jgi:hypothetical protein
MSIWQTMTGSDLTREWKAFETRAEALPADYRAAWEQIKVQLFPYGGFTGRNLMPIFDGPSGCSRKQRRMGRAFTRCWATTSGASARRWPARKGAGAIATDGASS